MLILLPRALLLCSIIIACHATHECHAADVTIINLADHPVVVGIYAPGDATCDQTLISISSSTQISDGPLQATEHEQFAIA